MLPPRAWIVDNWGRTVGPTPQRSGDGTTKDPASRGSRARGGNDVTESRFRSLFWTQQSTADARLDTQRNLCPTNRKQKQPENRRMALVINADLRLESFPLEPSYDWLGSVAVGGALGYQSRIPRGSSPLQMERDSILVKCFVDSTSLHSVLVCAYLEPGVEK